MNHLDPNNTVAIVLDDDEDTRFAISRILGKCECEVLEASSVDAALTLMKETRVDIIFSDLRIPGEAGGEELLGIAIKEHPEIAVVLMSCAMDAKSRSRFMNAGALDCLEKPFFRDTCLQILHNIRKPLKKSA